MTNIDIPQLTRLIQSSFSLEEIKRLCFDLGINYEDIAGITISDKAMHTVLHFTRHGRLGDVITYCKRTRPHIAYQFDTVINVPAPQPTVASVWQNNFSGLQYQPSGIPSWTIAPSQWYGPYNGYYLMWSLNNALNVWHATFGPHCYPAPVPFQINAQHNLYPPNFAFLTMMRAALQTFWMVSPGYWYGPFGNDYLIWTVGSGFQTWNQFMGYRLYHDPFKQLQRNTWIRLVNSPFNVWVDGGISGFVFAQYSP